MTSPPLITFTYKKHCMHLFFAGTTITADYIIIVQFKTEEVQRCIKASKGKYYEVEVCVATTATYGDKFRGVCRHRYFIPSAAPHAVSRISC